MHLIPESLPAGGDDKGHAPEASPYLLVEMAEAQQGRGAASKQPSRHGSDVSGVELPDKSTMWVTNEPATYEDYVQMWADQNYGLDDWICWSNMPALCEIQQ